LLGTNRGIGIGPLRATNSTEQDRIGFLAGLQRCLRQRLAMRVDRTAADRMLFKSEFMAEVFGDRVQCRRRRRAG
jgi:hypothetical protein